MTNTETTCTIASEERDATVSDLVAVMKQRTSTYGLLSRLYRSEVDDQLLRELHNLHYRVSTGNPSVDEGYRLIATYVSGIWENTPTELAADYLRTFYGHGYNGHAAAYPFESVYTSEKRLLMQGARDEVLALYRAAGLDKQKDWKEGEDHLALELEYMQIISERTVENLCKGKGDAAAALIRTQFNFMEDHLIGWVPMMTDAMKTFSKTDFYRGLAFWTEGFLETDEGLLSDLMDNGD